MALVAADAVFSPNASDGARRVLAPWIVALSLVVHVALAAALYLLPIKGLPVPRERSVAVEVISQRQFEALTPAEPTVETAEPLAVVEAVEPAPEAPAEAGPGMVRATHLFAGDVLAEPGSKEVRETLPLLDGGERIVQLCNIEALEQIPQWNTAMHPDVLVAYAMADTRLVDHELVADGGAFRSDHGWYAIRFRCVVAADFQSVTAFEFAVGAAIPEAEWASHDLTAEDEAED